MIDEISAEFGDCHVKLLHPSGISDEPYHWPAQEDRSWFPREDILCGVQFGLDAVTGVHQQPHEVLSVIRESYNKMLNLR